MMQNTRLAWKHRLLHGLLSASALAASGTASHAQEAPTFPNKPVTIVTPFSPGSGPDSVLRLIGEKLSKVWGQRVIVDNRPGGGGFIAIDAAKRAAPDGYTLLQLDSEHVAALPFLYKQRGFRTLDTFDPVATLFQTHFMVAVPADSKWKSMKDLIDAAKAQEGKMLYGSWGIGSPGHLGAAMLESSAGIGMQHVPYRDTAQIFISVSTHDLAWSFGTVPSSQAAYKGGKIKYLAIAAPQRIPQFPDVPTVAEAGGPPNLEVSSFALLVMPKGSSPALRKKINADVDKAVRDPDIVARFDTFAFEPISWSEAEILRRADAKAKVYEQQIRRGNIALD